MYHGGFSKQLNRPEVYKVKTFTVKLPFVQNYSFMPINISKPFATSIQKILNTSIQSITPVSGGDINETAALQTPKGSFFIKYNNIPSALDMFQKEAKGLQLLQATEAIKIPNIISVGEADKTAFLLLEWIPTGYRNNKFFTNFGIALAALHRHTAPKFGLNHHNYIGRLYQNNKQHDTWADFYFKERLLPQLQKARQQSLLQHKDEQALERLYQKLPSICPKEPPALTHGDLWSGNFIAHQNGQPVLIDPAVSYAHREMDIAMSRLFGGFGRSFYEAYQSHFPMATGWASRIEVYQLYYLLVHVNLFGRSYVSSVRQILNKY